ncbi:hypothetical protein M569_17702 [Genlisea aurea]|uniref:Uncharacterized protein n=1 Tax=Genlisea aurea TaxID=192259 RepID=S8BR67_9LAMI|nr:hypothetical protein M569_17702 [Genlisea aurea]
MPFRDIWVIFGRFEQLFRKMRGSRFRHTTNLTRVTIGEHSNLGSDSPGVTRDGELQIGRRKAHALTGLSFAIVGTLWVCDGDGVRDGEGDGVWEWELEGPATAGVAPACDKQYAHARGVNAAMIGNVIR